MARYARGGLWGGAAVAVCRVGFRLPFLLMLGAKVEHKVKHARGALGRLFRAGEVQVLLKQRKRLLVRLLRIQPKHTQEECSPQPPPPPPKRTLEVSAASTFAMLT